MIVILPWEWNHTGIHSSCTGFSYPTQHFRISVLCYALLIHWFMLLNLNISQFDYLVSWAASSLRLWQVKTFFVWVLSYSTTFQHKVAASLIWKGMDMHFSSWLDNSAQPPTKAMGRGSESCIIFYPRLLWAAKQWELFSWGFPRHFIATLIVFSLMWSSVGRIFGCFVVFFKSFVKCSGLWPSFLFFFF